jgi:hypothetical protein
VKAIQKNGKRISLLVKYVRQCKHSPGTAKMASEIALLITLNRHIKIYVTTDGQWPVFLVSSTQAGARDPFFITVKQLRICSCGTSPLIRGRVCRLQLLLGLASAVILEPEFRWTHDHILLSQI